MQHKNFCESDALNVINVETVAGKLVAMSQFSGSMHFSYCMTPSQARELAADLVNQADEAEGVTPSTKADVAELLKALQAMLEVWEHGGVNDYPIAQARAAIYKATGKTA